MKKLLVHREILIGLAALLAAAAGVALLIHTSMEDPLEASAPAPRGEVSAAPVKPRWARDARSAVYDEIPARNLFRQSVPGQSENGEAPAVMVTALPPVRFEARSDQQQAPLHTPERDRITVVGRIVLGGVEQAVVEDLGRGETQFVPVGGSAFNYRFVELTPHGAVMEREGKTFTIEYGAYKPAPQVRATARTIVTPGTTLESVEERRASQLGRLAEAANESEVTVWETQ